MDSARGSGEPELATSGSQFSVDAATVSGAQKRSWGVLVAIALLRSYQRILSPLLAVLFRSGCRFHPTCSEYAIQAFSRYGVFRGVLKTLRRLSRCHPFHPGGHDPLTF